MTKTVEQQIAEAVAAERERCAQIAEAQEDESDKASYPYDGGSGSLGYESACRDIASAVRAAPSSALKDEIMAGFDRAIDAIKSA